MIYKMLFSSSCSKFRDSNNNLNILDPIFLQDIIMTNKNVYIPTRRFKINMVLRSIVKDNMTNYLSGVSVL